MRNDPRQQHVPGYLCPAISILPAAAGRIPCSGPLDPRAHLPRWADIRTPANASRFEDLGPGEREAIALALEVNAGFVLMDENLGRRTAVQVGVAVKGTVGVLEDGAARNLVDLPEAIRRLRATSIFLAASPSLL